MTSVPEIAQILIELKYHCKKRNKSGKPICIHPGCNITANYNYEGNRKRLYCATHGNPKGMINVNIMRSDVHTKKRRKKCIEPGFNVPTKKRQKKCMEPGCNVTANYNFAGTREKMYCATHGRPKGMVNVCLRTNHTVQAAASMYLFR
jgi:riboflavin synthase